MKRLIFAALLAAGIISPALAQEAPTPVRVRGTVVNFSGNVLTVNGITGAPTKITMVPHFNIAYVVKGSLDKVKAGSYIGTAAEPQPDGTLKALEIQIFPPGFKAGAGSHPWDLTPTSTMTNGTVTTIGATKVASADAHLYTVTYEGGEKKVVVTPNTVAVQYEPADASALTPGSHVIVFATKAADGSYTGTIVSVGKAGLVPPM